MLKIFGGKYRSRSIEVPLSETVPTKNRVREALMSALSFELNSARVLDLFAGSGALGIESLSRGASSCVFVDASTEAYECIRHNLNVLKEENGSVINLDFLSSLNLLASRGEKFDIVYLDPPYAQIDYYQSSIEALLKLNLLSPEAALVIESDGEIPLNLDAFSKIRHYTYGRNHVVIARR